MHFIKTIFVEYCCPPPLLFSVPPLLFFSSPFAFQSPPFSFLSPPFTFPSPPFTFLSPPFTFLVDGCVPNSSPDHATPSLPTMRYGRDFGGQALSLYNWYIEREGGLPVSLQLWSTQDRGQHCKISCPPIQYLRPPTQLIRQHKPGNHKTPCRRRRDLKRMEQRRLVHGGEDQVHGARDQVQGAGDQVHGAGDQVQVAGD